MNAEQKLRVSRVALGALFFGAAVLHLTQRAFFEHLVPSYLASIGGAVGVATEVALLLIAVLFFVPRLAGVARWVSTALLLATLPAAIAQVLNPDQVRALGIPFGVAVMRIPIQMLVLVWIWRSTRTLNESKALA